MPMKEGDSVSVYISQPVPYLHQSREKQYTQTQINHLMGHFHEKKNCETIALKL
jgi:hypothetical protein